MKVTKSSLQALVILGVAASSNAANLRGGGYGEPGAAVLDDVSPGGEIPPQPWASSGRDNIAYHMLKAEGPGGYFPPYNVDYEMWTPNPCPRCPGQKFGDKSQAHQPVAAPTAFYAEGISRQPEAARTLTRPVSSNAAILRGEPGIINIVGDKSQAHPDTMVMPGNPSLKSAPFFGETAPAPRQPEGQAVKFVGRDNIAYAEQGYLRGDGAPVYLRGDGAPVYLRGDGAPGIAAPRSQVATYNK